jgi:hypothetical protein
MKKVAEKLELNDKAYITFGSQMGDTDAANTVQPHLIKLRKLLVKYCNETYCKEVDEFAPILRVDGEGWYWEFEGCEKLRLSKKNRYITIDVGMPISRWKDIGELEIRKYLISNLREALELMVKRLKKEKYTVTESELWADFSEVEENFLLK